MHVAWVASEGGWEDHQLSCISNMPLNCSGISLANALLFLWLFLIVPKEFSLNLDVCYDRHIPLSINAPDTIAATSLVVGALNHPCAHHMVSCHP